MTPPAVLRFAPCDFETQDIRDALDTAGFDVNEPAFVSWLGVTQYLTRSAIAETLRWAADLATGSEILVAYLVPSREVEAARAGGAPSETFLSPEEIETLLSEAGLGAEQFTPNYLDALYFQDRVDGLRAPTGERLIIGRVA